MSWMKNRHTCYECGAKWCASLNASANQHHDDGSDSGVDKDPANNYTWTDNEDEIEDINPKRDTVIRQIGKYFISAILYPI